MTNLNKLKSFLQGIPFVIGLILAVLLPIFIIPVETISFWASKNIILSLAVILLFIFWSFDRIKNRNFFLSKNILVILAVLVPVVYLLSALFSGSILFGLLGVAFEVSSFVTIATLFILMFLSAKAFQTEKQVLYLYTGLMISAVITIIFHSLRFILGPEFLSFNILNSSVSNLVGNWNELGIFFGLIVIINLIANEYLGKNKIIKISSIVLMVISLLFIWLVNFNLIWIFLGIISLFLIIYNLILSKFNLKELYKKPSIYVFLITLIFILFQGKIGGILPSLLNTSNLEVQPTIASTLDIAKPTLKENPILGAGPSKFVNQWVAYKPQGVNTSEFWNIDFNTGNSFIISSLVTVGLLGFVSWVLFIIVFMYLGFRLIMISRKDEINHFVALSLFLLSVYLILFLIFYIPGITILGLTFLILGVLLSFLNQNKLVKIIEVPVKSSKIKSAILIVTTIAILGASLFWGFLFTKRVIASTQFNRALVAINIEQDFGKAYQLIINAIITDSNDFYFRNLTDLNLVQLQNILNQEDIDDEVLREQFQTTFSSTLAAAEKAVYLDVDNYLNWVNLAKLYSAVIPLQLEGAYEKALETYIEAIKLNPTNPLLILDLANLEITHGDTEKAREYIGMAIQMKNNYSEAYYLLSQLEFAEGNTEVGTQVIEILASVTPNDSQVFLQLGILNYDKNDFEKAKASLERSVILSPYSIDAKYLLGLTYNAIGERDNAVAQFKDLEYLIPDNETIKIILANIEAGSSPFYGFEQEPESIQIEEINDEEMEEDLILNEEI
ncbi:MAG: tetratricopeptide repeat protein [Candidatus Pacebacteria bacterium]|nr:tetratricopeptide repeat protein [Candidatus Paceibacterota bacterium]